MSTQAPTADLHFSDENTQYQQWLALVGARLATVDGPLFTTKAAGLFDAFLAKLPEPRRQHYRCNACRRFVDTYGGLVTVAEDGTSTPVFWDADTAPPFFAEAVEELERHVRRAYVDGVFLSKDAPLGTSANWGKPSPGAAALDVAAAVSDPKVLWRHLSATLPERLVYRGALLTAGQAMAAKREDHKTLIAALSAYLPSVVRQAVTLLKTDALYRSEKVLGAAEWLLALHEARNAAMSARDINGVTWLAVATAPTGFCHIKSTMIGTLLDDLAAGLPFEQVKRRFDEKMNPLAYQRTQAPPAAGNVAEAERVFEKLGLAPALERRFARLDEIQTVWVEPASKAEPTKGGVFGHLATKESVAKAPPPLTGVPPTVVTWEKFARIALPSAARLELLVPDMDAFCAYVTAVNPEAPPILQWDALDHRNPVSWYLYSSKLAQGSRARDWALVAGQWHAVRAVSELPCYWGRPEPERFKHFLRGALLVLDGARDLKFETAGCAIFPETLKSELHAVRSTIEAYSRGAALRGVDQASVCGLLLREGMEQRRNVRVTSSHGDRIVYTIDRWD